MWKTQLLQDLQRNLPYKKENFILKISAFWNPPSYKVPKLCLSMYSNNLIELIIFFFWDCRGFEILVNMHVNKENVFIVESVKSNLLQKKYTYLRFPSLRKCNFNTKWKAYGSNLRLMISPLKDQPQNAPV